MAQALRPVTPNLEARPPPTRSDINPFYTIAVDPHVAERAAAAMENLLYCLLMLDDIVSLGPPTGPQKGALM